MAGVMVQATPAVVAESLLFRYPQHPVLRHLSLNVAQGERVLITGDNGVGKTTLLKILAGLLSIEAGRLQRSGDSVGLQLTESLTHPRLTVGEQIRLHSAVRG